MVRLLSVLLCFILPSCLWAQEAIQTQPHSGIEDLVKNLFIKGNCKNVSNITAIGNVEISIGQFSSGTDMLNVAEGIILSTGAIDLAAGPNESSEVSFAFDAPSDDPDLNQLATSDLFDVTGIEFDFVPLDNNVSFRYVFASEEYCEFVGTAFNDVFGFFVSGPDINGAFSDGGINVATLIGTNEDVSINTVNHLQNENLYVNNVTNLDAEACEIGFSPEFENLIEYDGFTIPLTASFSVIPCETYHIRLLVGDVGDAILDSAVFLESNSFDLGEKVNIRAEVPDRDEPIAYEDCVDGQFVFTRSSLIEINEPCTVDYLISGDSEATNGLDFLEIPLTITIPAGDTSFTLPISVIEDNIPEGIENLKLEFSYACDCIDPVSTELLIAESTDLAVVFEDITVCSNQTFNLTPEISGGVSPFSFLWETGITSDTLVGSTTESTNYTVTITDFCGDTSINTVSVNLQETPSATLDGIFDLCENEDIGIPVQLEGNPPWSIEYHINEIQQTPINNILVNPYYLDIEGIGTYTITAFNDAYCEGNITGNALVEQNSFMVAAEVTAPSCPNSLDGSIELTQLEAIFPYMVAWNPATEDSLLLDNLPVGIYTLSITDGNDCLYEEIFNLEPNSDDLEECAPFYIPNSFSPNNDGINDNFSIFLEPESIVKSVSSLQIFSRWGELIFEQQDFVPNNGATNWQGKHKGKPLDTGIYIYKIIFALEDESQILVSGDVTLLR